MSRGGKRPGAGRPAIGPRFEVRLPVEMIDALDAVAENYGVTRSELIRQIIIEAYPNFLS